MKDISAIVRDGDPELQTGTQVDRHMIDKADRMMDAPIWEKDPASNGGSLDQRDPYLDGVVSDIFTSAGRDHIAVGEHLLSEKGDDFQGVEVQAMPPRWITHDPEGRARILSYGEVHDLPCATPSFSEYNRTLAEATEQTLGQGSSEHMKSAPTYRYNQVSEVMNPQTDQPEPP